MKKIEVNKEVCIGCGACTAIASDVFEFGDDGLAEVKKDIDVSNVKEELENDVVDAAEGCPTGAITAE